MSDSIQTYCRLWLDQNVGRGPALGKRDAETLALAAEFLRDARHCLYSREDIDALGAVEYRIMKAREVANGASADHARQMAAPRPAC